MSRIRRHVRESAFIDKASYVAANDYEFDMMLDRTGLTLPDIAGRLKALIVTRGEKLPRMHS